ncbi:membrane protein [Photobacterium iliopiscarium]|jgi:uncharacterized membrane protein|uniref:MotA/TolQ/ExbB proton channel domain-containing protein n=1 Tax=Photobacterium iliopiscarium TaxID=56192 RepID=A0A0D8PU98_9GAMM|nr:hypothetical protein [Photobacterium iliopiscarium]KJG22506.1 membrane protein [Photobacterium iliopiscarium]PST91462.1 hypothetical protein C9I87_15030 [Photobacterium iliopiscarium]PSU00618.1 hypothetical protein C9I85_06970 [Photobacterium iliopiscarium]PSV82304.1 hypothetical protein C9J51_11815 [Photobacterium iliopiscarium]PSV98161.1 hypothetical protein C9I88_05705 [Photobacterium iliopiscarium]
MTEEHKKGIWFAYIASFLTPFTLLLSGIIAIIYAGYKLDKGADDITYSHYYTIIRSFFLFLTFFVVLGVSAATTTGMIAGAEYWVHSDILAKALNVLPFIGGAIAIVAIAVWFAKIINGMKLLSQNKAVKL